MSLFPPTKLAEQTTIAYQENEAGPRVGVANAILRYML